MCYQTRDYSPSHLSKFVNLGVDHWTGPPRPSTPFVKAAHWSGARDKFLWKVLLTPIRCQIWGMEWRGDLDCNRGWLRGFPRLPQYCGAACGLPPIGAILTSDGANPGLQGAGSVSGRRSSYTFMYCPYYPTAAHSLPDRSPGKRNCNHCESCWIRTIWWDISLGERSLRIDNHQWDLLSGWWSSWGIIINRVLTPLSLLLD